ncbi:PP2C family protein-serine/threonine phosphatase [Streptomyces sp. NPDC004311]|uniref:PP2C family protein-serine/threonine phosphatase n=1 Tax=Streptomyces sp. NPDC004311 TaxID=3364698 RepID=UPI0036C370C6
MEELESALAWVLEHSHGASARDVAGLIDDAARRLGLGGARLYLADVQQRLLVPLSRSGPVSAPAISASGLEETQKSEYPLLEIDGTLAGLAYRSQQVQRAQAGAFAWVPMVDGIERIGVMWAEKLSADSAAACRALAGLAALLVVSKSSHNDLLVEQERTRPMSLQAELVWAFLPPRTIGNARATSTAVLEPAYDIGGDAFDHSFIDGILHLTLLDAMGHDLASGGASAVGLAACRSTRRSGGSLPDIATTIEHSLTQWIPDRLMTAVIAEIDTRDGDLVWINCGHPSPLLIRDGHVVQGALERPAQLPLGLGFHAQEAPVLHRTRLQPGDRVLIYSDGVTEARTPDGDLFGEQRLTDTVIRCLSSGDNAPEALRRLTQNLLEHQDQRLRDDATILLAEWHPPS